MRCIPRGKGSGNAAKGAIEGKKPKIIKERRRAVCSRKGKRTNSSMRKRFVLQRGGETQRISQGKEEKKKKVAPTTGISFKKCSKKKKSFGTSQPVY